MGKVATIALCLKREVIIEASLAHPVAKHIFCFSFATFLFLGQSIVKVSCILCLIFLYAEFSLWSSFAIFHFFRDDSSWTVSIDLIVDVLATKALLPVVLINASTVTALVLILCGLFNASISFFLDLEVTRNKCRRISHKSSCVVHNFCFFKCLFFIDPYIPISIFYPSFKCGQIRSHIIWLYLAILIIIYSI